MMYVIIHTCDVCHIRRYVIYFDVDTSLIELADYSFPGCVCVCVYTQYIMYVVVDSLLVKMAIGWLMLVGSINL